MSLGKKLTAKLLGTFWLVLPVEAESGRRLSVCQGEEPILRDREDRNEK